MKIRKTTKSIYNKLTYVELKYFCRYCVQVLSTIEISKLHINDCFKIDDKQTIIMPKESEPVKFRNDERK